MSGGFLLSLSIIIFIVVIIVIIVIIGTIVIIVIIIWFYLLRCNPTKKSIICIHMNPFGIFEY